MLRRLARWIAGRKQAPKLPEQDETSTSPQSSADAGISSKLDLSQVVIVRNQSIALMEANRFDEAQDLLLEALSAIDPSEDSGKQMGIVLHSGLAQLEEVAGNLKSAEVHCKRVVALRGALHTDVSGEVWVVLHSSERHLEEIQTRLGRPEGALQRLVVRLHATPEDDLRTRHIILDQIAALRISQKDYHEALAVVEQGRAVWALEWDKKRIKPQWNQMEKVIMSHVQNA